jgi:hypothetical protein
MRAIAVTGVSPPGRGPAACEGYSEPQLPVLTSHVGAELHGHEPCSHRGPCPRHAPPRRPTSAASPRRRCSTGPSRRTSRPSWRGRAGRTGRARGRRSSGASSRRTSGVASSTTVSCACAVSGAVRPPSSGSAAKGARVLSVVRRPAHERARRPPRRSRPAACADPVWSEYSAEPHSVHRPG